MHVIKGKDLIHLINSGICKINGEKEMLATITRDGNKIIAVIKKEDLPKDECYLDFCHKFFSLELAYANLFINKTTEPLFFRRLLYGARAHSLLP